MITRKHAILSNGLMPPNDETARAIYKALDDYADARVEDFITWLLDIGYMKPTYRLLQDNTEIHAEEYTPSMLYRRYQIEAQKKYLEEYGNAESI
jgi:hypothetical protein